MKSDSMPAFALEKEALKTEIEAGIQTGVEQMESGQKGKCIRRRPAAAGAEQNGRCAV